MGARMVRSRAGLRGVVIRSLSCRATGDRGSSAAEELEQLKRDNDRLRERLHAIQMKSSGTPELFPCMDALNPCWPTCVATHAHVLGTSYLAVG